MLTMFFASDMFEILQVQNIATQLKLEKKNTYLVLWLYQANSFTKYMQYVELNIFSDIIFIQRPVWKTNIWDGRQNLLKTQQNLENLLKTLDIKEIFIPDPEKEYQILEPLCKNLEIKLSLYENGINLYRYLNSDDPNKRGIIYRVNILIKIVKIF
ncbi:MAG: polysialyltransferase family glycosyltransferase, partial [Brevinema sp.]